MSNNPNSGSIRLLSIAAVAILSVAGMAACTGQGGATAAAADAAQDVRNEGNSDEASAPAWYLAEFPQHPDLRLKSVTQPGSGAWLLTYQAGGGSDGEALVDWFKTHYSQDGWTIDMEQGDSRFNAEKGDAYSAVVGITATKYATIVSITARGG